MIFPPSEPRKGPVLGAFHQAWEFGRTIFPEKSPPRRSGESSVAGRTTLYRSCSATLVQTGHRALALRTHKDCSMYRHRFLREVDVLPLPRPPAPAVAPAGFLLCPVVLLQGL